MFGIDDNFYCNLGLYDNGDCQCDGGGWCSGLNCGSFLKYSDGGNSRVSKPKIGEEVTENGRRIGKIVAIEKGKDREGNPFYFYHVKFDNGCIYIFEGNRLRDER